ncbi:DUF6122 family protein [Polaribacter sp. PL03]|uniref:DUF6122 family protein n=1 Tax=Polaribacter sp. PL03 TaxID=3088353 RepID=UPI0029D16D39|nr:DUF6122 family protein [Polaribacter sp. PL03]MDX6747853.1 DUF6122 family protein [Polaribacter sp. PL03]
MITSKFILHYSLHFLFPFLIAFVFFRKKWKTVYLIFLFSMFVDLDHLLANPIFDKTRCSINFHPLHSYIAITIYFFGLVFKKTRILCIALLFHMLTDYIDCYL